MTLQAKPQRGKVLVEGDKVIFGKYSGAEIEHNGRKYLLLDGSDILTIEE